MKLIILKTKFGKFFGFKIETKNYILQVANWKFGIWCRRTYRWFPDDFKIR